MTDTAQVTGFLTDERVRLLADYRGKPLANISSRFVFEQPGFTTIAAGTEFVVVGRSHTNWNRQQVVTRLDGPTTVVKNEAGTWCIPTRLLEAVKQQQPAGEDADRDAEANRVG